MKIRCDIVSDKGRVRSNNEDMALVFGERVRDSSISFTYEETNQIRFLAIVSDGMGGYEGGEIASEMATTSFNKFLNTLPDCLEMNNLIMAVKQWGVEVNEAIIKVAQGNGMGCTLCGIFCYEENAYIINIGDSRLYRLRYGLFKQLTTDHSIRNRIGDSHIPSNLIYNALGVDGAFIDIMPTKLVVGDRYLICSDGLSDLVDDETVKKILIAEDGDSRQLIDAAMKAGGTDNITVILLNILDY